MVKVESLSVEPKTRGFLAREREQVSRQVEASGSWTSQIGDGAPFSPLLNNDAEPSGSTSHHRLPVISCVLSICHDRCGHSAVTSCFAAAISAIPVDAS